MSKKNVTYFQDEWLDDDRFPKWVMKTHLKTHARCSIYQRDFDLSTMGVSALLSHARGKKHKDKLTSLSKDSGIAIFFSCLKDKESKSGASGSSKPINAIKSTHIENFVVPANAIRAEILWFLKVVITHSSLWFCENLNELFQAIFSDIEIAESFKLGKTKCGYFINYGLAPFFKTNLIKSVKGSPFFTASFDESLNRIYQNEQIDVHNCFWDNEKGLVKTNYLDSRFVFRPIADNLHDELHNTLQSLPEKKHATIVYGWAKYQLENFWNVI